jgi:hypothetical protein
MLAAMLMNPLASQWPNPMRMDNSKVFWPQTAADFPTMPPADPAMAQSQLAQSLGINAMPFGK